MRRENKEAKYKSDIKRQKLSPMKIIFEKKGDSQRTTCLVFKQKQVQRADKSFEPRKRIELRALPVQVKSLQNDTNRLEQTMEAR